MIWYYEVSVSFIMFLILAVFGTAGMIIQNIMEELYYVMMFVLFIAGVLFYQWQMKEREYGRTIGAGILAMLSLVVVFAGLAALRLLLKIEMTKELFFLHGGIMVAVIVINGIVIHLVDNHKGVYMLIIVGLTAAVALYGYLYYLNKDIIASKQEYAVIYSYTVAEDNTPLYGLTQGTVWEMGEQKKTVDDTRSEIVIDTLSAGETVKCIPGSVDGPCWQKVQTESGLVGYAPVEQMKPYEYETRYQVQYAR